MTRRRWLLVVVGAWAVLLIVLAFTAHGKPTVARQQSPAAARGAVTDAVLDVLAAGRGIAVATVDEYQRHGRCRISVDRDGVDYRRTVDLYGSGGHLLRRLTGRLPDDFHATSVPVVGADTRVTVARPDPFLRLTLRSSSGDPGHVRAVVDTGCRPTTGDPYPRFVPAPTDAERAPVARVFSLLGVSPGEWRRAGVGCGSSGAVSVTATGVAAESLGPLPSVLGDGKSSLPGTVLAQGDDRYVYQQPGGAGLVVDADADTLTVTRTTPC